MDKEVGKRFYVTLCRIARHIGISTYIVEIESKYGVGCSNYAESRAQELRHPRGAADDGCVTVAVMRANKHGGTHAGF